MKRNSDRDTTPAPIRFPIKTKAPDPVIALVDSASKGEEEDLHAAARSVFATWPEDNFKAAESSFGVFALGVRARDGSATIAQFTETMTLFQESVLLAFDLHIKVKGRKRLPTDMPNFLKVMELIITQGNKHFDEARGAFPVGSGLPETKPSQDAGEQVADPASSGIATPK